MKQRERFQELEKALNKYRIKATDLPIRFNDLMVQLEGCFGEFYRKKDQSKRSRVFFDAFHEKMFNVDTTAYWFSFWEVALIQFIDLYFQTQIEHHGFHVLAAKEILADPEMLENPEYWLNSAHPSEVHTVEYYQKLLACQTLWHKLSAEARQNAKAACFPLPIRT